jgi:hypothetical protein
MTQEKIRIRIPAKLKEEMDEISIDWNEYICQCIQEKQQQGAKNSTTNA